MKKRVYFVIFILTIGIIAMLGWNQMTKRETPIETKALDPQSDLVQGLYQMANPSEDATVLSTLYKTNSFSNEYILSTGIANFLRKMQEPPNFISKKEVEQSIHDVFGYDIDFVHESVFILVSGVCKYAYQPNTEQYRLVVGCGGNSNEKFYRKIINATQKNNKIQITEKLIYMYNDWDEHQSRIYLYNNYQKEKVLDYFEKSSTEQLEINIEEYLSQASTYIYTFKLQNNNYIFEEIKQV